MYYHQETRMRKVTVIQSLILDSNEGEKSRLRSWASFFFCLAGCETEIWGSVWTF